MEKPEPPELCALSECSPASSSNLVSPDHVPTDTSPEIVPEGPQTIPNQKLANAPSVALGSSVDLPNQDTETYERHRKRANNPATDAATEQKKQIQDSHSGSLISNQAQHPSDYFSEIINNPSNVEENAIIFESEILDSQIPDPTLLHCPKCETELRLAMEAVARRRPLANSTLELWSQKWSDPTLLATPNCEKSSAFQLCKFVIGYFDDFQKCCQKPLTASTILDIQIFVSMYSTQLIPCAISSPIIQVLQTFLEAQKQNLERFTAPALQQILKIPLIDCPKERMNKVIELLGSWADVKGGCQRYQNCKPVLSCLATIPALYDIVRSIETCSEDMKRQCGLIFKDSNTIQQAVRLWHTLDILQRLCNEKAWKDVLETLPVYQSLWESKLKNEIRYIFKQIGWYAHQSTIVTKRVGTIFPCSSSAGSSHNSPRYQEDHFMESSSTNLYRLSYSPDTPDPPISTDVFNPVVLPPDAFGILWDDPNYNYQYPLTAKGLHSLTTRMKMIAPFFKEQMKSSAKIHPDLLPFGGNLFLAGLYFILQSIKNDIELVVNSLEQTECSTTVINFSQVSESAKFFAELLHLEEKDDVISDYIRTADEIEFLDTLSPSPTAGVVIEFSSPGDLRTLINDLLSSTISPAFPWITPVYKVAHLRRRALLARFTPGNHPNEAEYRSALANLIAPHREFIGDDLLNMLFGCLMGSGNDEALIASFSSSMEEKFKRCEELLHDTPNEAIKIRLAAVAFLNLVESLKKDYPLARRLISPYFRDYVK